MTSVDSPQNKGLLWNVLLENGSFSGIPETKIGEVNRLLNEVVEEVLVGGGANGQTTMESNKKVLAEMSRRLGVYRALASTTNTTNTTTTRDDIQKERIDRMNNLAKQMSVDMSQYAPKKPKSVRFSDDVDKLSPEILESRLEQAIASRNLDIVAMDVSGGSGGSGGVVKNMVNPIPTQKGSDQDMTQMYNEVKEMYTEMKQMLKDLKK